MVQEQEQRGQLAKMNGTLSVDVTVRWISKASPQNLVEQRPEVFRRFFEDLDNTAS
jgi:hypothetical protein